MDIPDLVTWLKERTALINMLSDEVLKAIPKGSASRYASLSQEKQFFILVLSILQL